MVQHFLGTLKLPMAIYMLDYYLPMLSPNDGYNETGLTMQSAGPVREEWQPIHLSYLYQGSAFDIVHCAQQIYTGTAASDSQVLLDRPRRKWAQWVFSLEEVWQEDVPMQDRPLMVHCSGLGGGLLSPDHDYDLFFQNHAQMKVYGPSLAMIDDWEQRVTQLGLTKTTMNMRCTNSLLLLWVGECGESFCQLNSQIISYCSPELCAY